MSILLAPRIRGGAEPVAVAPSVPPALAVGLFVVIALVGVLLPGTPGFRVLMGGLAVFAALSAGMLVIWTRAVVAGRVRVDERTPALRFVPPRLVSAGMLALAAVALATGVLALGLRLAGVTGAGEAGVGRFGPTALGLVGLVWLAQQLGGMRIPAGLTLDVDGIRGVRGSRRVSVAWDEVAGAHVVAGRVARLVVSLRDGRVVVLDPHWFGSDPNVVAAVVEHFADRAADRARLTDAHLALRAVEDARG